MEKIYPLGLFLFLMLAGMFATGSLLAQAPAITAFSPASGAVGTTVTITGSRFNTTAGNNIVFFGSLMATVSSATASSLTVAVPAGASYQNISVTDITTGLTAYSAKPFIVTFANWAINYATRADQITGTNPWGVAVGDLDGDGKPDLVISNVGSASISVFQNTSTAGTVSFTPKTDFTVGTSPVNVTIGDLDGDGKPEVVVANQGSASLSIFRNTSTPGTITLIKLTDLTTGTTPVVVAIGDLDGDGKPDLAVANYGSATVSTFRNGTTLGGNITFGTKVDFGVGTNPRGLAIGDLDGDGKPEIATGNQGSNTMSVLRNTSSTAINFATKFDYAVGTQPNGVAIGDLDGDGKPDVAVVNYMSSTVSVFLNAINAPGAFAAGSFAGKIDYTTGTNPRYVAFADLDGDGKLDMAVDNTGSSSVSVFRNTGSAGTISFAAKSDFTTGASPANLAIGDIDGDGKPDIAASNYSSGSASILRNAISPPTITAFSPAMGAIGSSVTITGTRFNTTAGNNIVFFGATMATVTSATATSLTVTVPVGASYQNISVTDVVTGLTAYSLTPFVVIYNNGVINYAAKVDQITGTNPYGVAVGDLDGDGKADIVVTNYGANTISVFLNTSTTGTIASTSFAAKVDFPAGANPNCVAIADMDGDGKPDLAVVNRTAASVSFFRNTSTPRSINFSAKGDLTTGSTPIFVTTADLDGDGRADILTANAGGASISLFHNITPVGGNIAFSSKTDLSVGSNPRCIAVGDLDGDGKPDIVTGNANATTVAVLRNISTSGNMAFAARVDYTTNTQPFGVAIGDIDGDGKADIVVANNGAANISVFLNAVSAPGAFTASSFTNKGDFASGTAPGYVAIADLDGDGVLDIAVQNNGSGSVSVYRNTSTPGTLNLTKTDYTVGSAPQNLAIGDLDGDGKSEIVTSNYGSATLSVLHNAPPVYYSKATGDLSALSTYGSLADGSGSTPADFNGSGSNAAYQLANRGTYSLTADLAIGSSLNIPAGTTLNLAGYGLTVSKLGSTGTLTGSNTSSLTVNGTVSNLVFATGEGQLKALNLGASVSVTLGSALYIASTGTLNLAANATLVTKGFLTLRSDAAGSASVGALGTGATISGNATVERYIANKRAWRLITPAVNSTQTINAAWQEEAGSVSANPNPGYGTLMIGNSTANGFDIAGTQSSLLVYDGISAFAGANNTNALTLSSNPGYFLFSIGDRSIDPNLPGAHSSTTLRSTGTLSTGTQAAVPVAASGFTLVGNPYASAVDFAAVTRNGVPNSFYAWDINLGTYGGYALITNLGGGYTASAGSLNNIIPSGGVIFVQGDGSGSSSLTFSEASKATGTAVATFSNFNATAVNYHSFRLGLNDAASHPVDGVMAVFADGYSDRVDEKDAPKMMNFGENIWLQRSGKQLTMECRDNIALKDTLFIQLSGMKPNSYQLKIDPVEFNVPGVTAYLVDAYLKKRSSVDLNQVNTITFAANADTASYKNRFSITFGPVSDPLKVSHANANVVAYPNPAVNKQVNLSFDGLPAGNYNIAVMNAFGQIMQKNSMINNGNTSSKLLTVNYSTGVYTVNIQAAGYNQSIKVIIP